MTTGYSKKPLVQKLGIKQGFKVMILNSPQNYNTVLGKLPEEVVLMKELKGPLDFIQFFTREKKELEHVFPILKRELSQAGMIWISWPKVKSGIATDLNESIIRNIGLNNHLVDVKVCAIDEIWSGLKFVRRLKSRF